MCDDCHLDRVRAAICKSDEQVHALYLLHKRKDISEEQKALLLDMMNLVAWDDAIHVAAPWEPRSSLCGQWGRNLVSLDKARPGGFEGCWTCLMAAEWIDRATAQEVEVETEPEREYAGATA